MSGGPMSDGPMSDGPPSDGPTSDGQGALVLGGAGFIGGHLLRDLAARRVGPLISLDVAEPARRVAGVDYRRGDVRRRFEGLVPETVAVVYNLAAVHRTPGHPDHEYYETNVAGAVNACRYASARGVGRILFTSSISVYGPREQACDESATLAPVTAYGRSKVLAEAVHEAWAAERPGRRLAILRPAVVFGPGEGGNFERLLRQLRRRAFVYPGRRDTIKGCGHVGELLRAMAFCTGRDEPVYRANFAYPDPCTIETIVRTLAAEAGLPAPSLTVPAAVMTAAGWVLEMAGRLGLRTGISRDLVRKLQVSTDIRPDRLLADGFRFESGLRGGIRAWLKDCR